MPVQSPVHNGGSVASPFSRPSKGFNGLHGSPEAERAKMEAFRKIKPTCVTLMSLATNAPTSHSSHAPLIDSLTRTLTSLPPQSLTTGMINYTLFPITQILRHHNPVTLPDLFLESTFRLLAHIVGVWKTHPGGMEIGAWEQLWRFVTAALAPRMGDIAIGKGKEKEIGHEVQLEAVHLLTALLEPTPSDAHSHPSEKMLEMVSTPKSPLMPTLFQTITLLLAVINPSTPNTALQLPALRLTRHCIKVYLRGQHPVLASILPGTVSAVSRLFQSSGKSLKGDVAAQATGLVEDVIVATLSDTDLRRLDVLRNPLDDLSQLADGWAETTSERPSSPTPSVSASTSSGKDPFPPLSKSYLDFTASQLLTALRPILHALTVHTSHLARQAASLFSFALLNHCHQSLPQLIPHTLSTLLLLTRDDFDPVRIESRRYLLDLLGKSDLQLDTALIDLLSEAINALPRLITSHQETKVNDAARLLTAIAETSSLSSDQNPIADLLGPRGKVERWGWALLDCLEFGRPTGWSSMGQFQARTAERAWENRLVTSDIPLLIQGAEGEPSESFPQLPLRYVESTATIRALGDTLCALGSAGGDAALHAVEYFVLFAKNDRGVNTISKAVSALWVAHQLFDGIAKGQQESAEGKIDKTTRKMARQITRVVVSMDEDEDDEEEGEGGGVPSEATETEALVPVERTKGLDTLTTLLDRPAKPFSHAANETRRLHVQAQKVLLTALSLSTLSLTSRILSSSFRPLLLTALYTLLSHLSSPHTLVVSYAETALSHVAYNAGYASVQNLILDNVDYVINVVSQRLRPSHLSSSAPLVLIAMIRLTRSEIVPMIHDLIDEIFDALDDYHGYEVLASGLLAVLVALVDVMSEDVKAEGMSEARQQKLKELDRIGGPPDPKADWEKFGSWWAERQARRKEEVGEILERAPQHAWGKPTKTEDTNGESKEGEEDGQDQQPAEEGETPPTRTQEICVLILEKSLNFLSHSSPFLRARILSLITHSVPVLAMGNREGDLLPLIDRSWGIILTRLDDSYPYVVVESAEVIAALCEHCGDFMSRRILNQAWPKFQKILATQSELDKKSAMVRKGAGPGGVVGSESAYTVSHRLHLAILRVATFIASKVPVEDANLWDMMVRFRPFLDVRVHEELQGQAMELYGVLGERDGDALWVCLKATVGELDEGLWIWLREWGIQLGDNATKLLEGV